MNARLGIERIYGMGSTMKLLKLSTLAACAMAGLLAGCGASTITETIGGTVINLSGGPIVLQDNLADNLTVASSGKFTFAKPIDIGSIYSVSVLTQPTGQVCSVLNSIGYVSQASGNVNSVVVYCVSSITSTDAVYGTVQGLKGTLALTNSGVESLSVTSSGTLQTFAFTKALQINSNYQVSIVTQPAGQTCTFNDTVISGVDKGPSNVGTVFADQVLYPVSITCQ